jgi:membrane fusion protein (multidrug efflux system)
MGELVGKTSPIARHYLDARSHLVLLQCERGGLSQGRGGTQRSGKKSPTCRLPPGERLKHPDQGKFVFIDRAVDIKTGTLRVRVEFSNTRKVLRPGMFGRIQVDLGQRPDSILVPERAVAELQGKNFVWVIGADSKATQRGVKVGGQLGENVLILEGLKSGDRIVVEVCRRCASAPVHPKTAARDGAGSRRRRPSPAGVAVIADFIRPPIARL